MKKKLELTNYNIDKISEITEGFLYDSHVEKAAVLRIKFTLEELLLKYQEAFGEKTDVTLNCTKRLGALKVELVIPGERLDPLENDSETNSNVLQILLANMGLAPTWQYKNGANYITFLPKKKKPSQMVSLMIAILAALVVGGAFYLLPENIRLVFSEQLISPIFNTFMGLLSAIAGPMIFLSVTWGIYSIGDTATLGRIGKKMITRFLVMQFILSVIALILFVPFFTIEKTADSSFAFSELFQMFLDIIPSNFFTPFTEGNPLQIIFVAVIIGLAMLILGNKTTTAASFVEQSNFIVQLIMETISGLIPFFVFGSILNMILGGNFAVLLKASKILPILLLGMMVCVVSYVILVSVRKKVNVMVLIKKLLPTFLIGLTTASSAAAFGTNVECCEKELGIDRRIVNFGIPLGQVVFMPGAAILFISAGICMAEVYGTSISPTWLITLMLISVILAVAAPPVPGGALTCYTILFMQLNIPAEALAITIALNVVLEFAATGVNLLCLQTELVELAGALDMLDIEKLRRSSLGNKSK